MMRKISDKINYCILFIIMALKSDYRYKLHFFFPFHFFINFLFCVQLLYLSGFIQTTREKTLQEGKVQEHEDMPKD